MSHHFGILFIFRMNYLFSIWRDTCAIMIFSLTSSLKEEHKYEGVALRRNSRIGTLRPAANIFLT